MNFLEQFADYQRTVYGREVFAAGDAWMTYQVIPGRGVYIADIYVEPGARRQGAGREMLEFVEDVARIHGLKYVFGSVDCTTNVWKESVAAQEACGFKPAIQNGSYLILVKEVSS